jgi:protein-S-isoprenylcysteine O-methyltransferase Ste14
VVARQCYVHTAALVDSGIYAFFRHLQEGVAGLLINLGVMLITRHWFVIAPGVVALALTYIDTFKENRYYIDKFGDHYRRYVQRAPRVNFAAGVIRLLRRGKMEEDR